jgi:hypothetical protein
VGRIALLVILAASLLPGTSVAATSLVSISPPRVNFGTKAVGTTTFKTLTVTNTGERDLLVYIQGRVPDDFGFGGVPPDSPCAFSPGAVLAPGESCEVFVRFSPTEFFVQFGRQTGTLEITVSDPSTLAVLGSRSITVTGTGRSL